MSISSLTPEALAELSPRQRDHFLQNLQNLSDDEVKILSSYTGALALSGVTRISDLAAEHLSKHRGKLSLWGLTHLSDTAAKSLASHDGPVLLFPLIETSHASRTLMQRHRENTCRSMGMPVGSEMDAYKGTFQKSAEDDPTTYRLIYYPHTIQDPVSITIHWGRENEMPMPKKIPDWLADLLPTFGKCIEEIYWQHASRKTYGGPKTAYLMEATLELHADPSRKIHSIYLIFCEEDADVSLACVDDREFPNEFHLTCYGDTGENVGTYPQKDFLRRLPLNHSMHDARLVHLKHWGSNENPLFMDLSCTNLEDFRGWDLD